MKPYLLYYAPDNASLIVRLVLNEMAQPFRSRLVDRGNQEQNSAEYQKLNPRGLIPTLVTENGSIFETAAILLWLTDRHAQLAPCHTSPDRGDYLKWLFYLSNGLHVDMRHLFYPEKYTSGPGDHGTHHDLVKQRIREHLILFENLASQSHSWFNGSEPSAIDYYVACILRWLALYPARHAGWFSFSEYPALQALAKRLETRQATLNAIQAEGLGLTPFSAPSYATPPEGSAT